MESRKLYDCFDAYDTGHLDSADTLFDARVWIGYLAEESRSFRYRGLPSYRELENNYNDLGLSPLTPLPDSPCNDREAVCRGCFCDTSRVLQLREIRFGTSSKVVIMPLKGPDDDGLFCIMLSQPVDQCIESLEAFRPFEHHLDNGNNKPLSSNFMLLSLRDRRIKGGLLLTVQSTLDPTELARMRNRPGRLLPISRLNRQPVEEVPIDGSSRSKGLLKSTKRKQQHAAGPGTASFDPAQRSGPVAIDHDNFAEPLSVPFARSSVPRAIVQQQTLISPKDTPQEAPGWNSTSQAAPSNKSYFNVEQARRIQWVWKFDYEGMEHEASYLLNDKGTFHDLLDSFREDFEEVPAANRQMKAKTWSVKYKLPDGTGKAVWVTPSSVDSERNFEKLLRDLAEKEVWKNDRDLIVNIEVKPIVMTSAE